MPLLLVEVRLQAAEDRPPQWQMRNSSVTLTLDKHVFQTPPLSDTARSLLGRVAFHVSDPKLSQLTAHVSGELDGSVASSDVVPIDLLSLGRMQEHPIRLVGDEEGLVPPYRLTLRPLDFGPVAPFTPPTSKLLVVCVEGASKIPTAPVTVAAELSGVQYVTTPSTGKAEMEWKECCVFPVRDENEPLRIDLADTFSHRQVASGIVPLYKLRLHEPNDQWLPLTEAQRAPWRHDAMSVHLVLFPVGFGVPPTPPVARVGSAGVARPAASTAPPKPAQPSQSVQPDVQRSPQPQPPAAAAASPPRPVQPAAPPKATPARPAQSSAVQTTPQPQHVKGPSLTPKPPVPRAASDTSDATSPNPRSQVAPQPAAAVQHSPPHQPVQQGSPQPSPGRSGQLLGGVTVRVMRVADMHHSLANLQTRYIFVRLVHRSKERLTREVDAVEGQWDELFAFENAYYDDPIEVHLVSGDTIVGSSSFRLRQPGEMGYWLAMLPRDLPAGQTVPRELLETVPKLQLNLEVGSAAGRPLESAPRPVMSLVQQAAASAAPQPPLLPMASSSLSRNADADWYISELEGQLFQREAALNRLHSAVTQELQQRDDEIDRLSRTMQQELLKKEDDIRRLQFALRQSTQALQNSYQRPPMNPMMYSTQKSPVWALTGPATAVPPPALYRLPFAPYVAASVPKSIGYSPRNIRKSRWTNMTNGLDAGLF
eukprot:TRINITY_DN7636_c0_g2_i1.p1 TRINITY_DN7636_c0_g2~~TRINITY_DN7636_c0_g2_i1.p1  ORF type:complete len:709 (+),score=110.91 TRINITY_DN7636_c0_g2_i1:136-2262(+)